MKTRRIALLIVLGILVILIAINVFKNQGTTLSTRDAQLTLSDTASIHQILIRRTNDTLRLLRKSNQTWVFSNQRTVNPAYIKFCFRIFGQIKISSVLPKNQWQAIRDSIVQKGVEVVLYNNQQEVLQNIYYFPDKQNQKTYALKKSAEEPFLVELPGYEGNFSGIFYLPQTHWYQPLIIHYLPSQVREVSVEHTDNPKKSFTLRLTGKQIPVLLDYEDKPCPYSKEAVKAYLTFLRNISVDRYLDNSHLYDSLLHTHPIYRISIIDQADSLNQLLFYRIQQRNEIDRNFCYVLISNGLVGILPYYQLDPVARPIDFFTTFENK